MEKDNRILASVALFSELFDRNRDVYHLVGEFVKSAVITERAWQFSIDDANRFLTEQFDFYLPKAVITKVLRGRLKADGFIGSGKGETYNVANPTSWSSENFTAEFDRLKANYAEIQQKLLDYSASFDGSQIKTHDEVVEGFYHFLLGDSVSEASARLYSAFIVENSSDREFTERLNLIREGLVIYSAVISAQEPNEQGVWRSDLIVVLDTELLLTMGGFNGPVFEQFFKDFHDLVKEINLANAKRNKSARIKLRFLEEGQNEIERIFERAEKVIAGRDNYSVPTTALRTIINGCSSPSDVLAKKARFYRRLDVEGIKLIEPARTHERIPFNVESQDLLAALMGEAGKYGVFTEDDIVSRLEQFTVINRLRGGVSSSQFELSGAILLTGDRLTRILANDRRVKFQLKDAPFAIDIDYITNRLWFNLNKGFRDQTSLPKSFDLVTKAQTVLAGQLRAAVNSRYAQYQDQYQSGEMDREEALLIFAEIRAKEVDPRRIDEESLDDVLELINDPRLDERIERLQKITQVAQNVPTLEFTLRSLKFENLLLRNRTYKSILKFVSTAMMFLLYASPVYAAFLAYGLVRLLQSESDTPLALIGAFLGFLLPLFPLWKKRHWLVAGISKLTSRAYRKNLNRKRGKIHDELRLLR